MTAEHGKKTRVRPSCEKRQGLPAVLRGTHLQKLRPGAAQDVSLYLEEGQKIGIIGAQRHRQEHPLRILAGVEEFTSGTLSRDPNVDISICPRIPPWEEGADAVEQVFLRQFPGVPGGSYESKTHPDPAGHHRF